ncbi:hypothetical protein [Arthrobacter sp. RCC_34]|uniref:hypothetical protein n=1 Tax=Arthrobacter sp. RCC_34 TaxID=3239230 RepID=UPI0035264329
MKEAPQTGGVRVAMAMVMAMVMAVIVGVPVRSVAVLMSGVVRVSVRVLVLRHASP